jgi:hypothetical protein
MYLKKSGENDLLHLEWSGETDLPSAKEEINFSRSFLTQEIHLSRSFQISFHDTIYTRVLSRFHLGALNVIPNCPKLIFTKKWDKSVIWRSKMVTNELLNSVVQIAWKKVGSEFIRTNEIIIPNDRVLSMYILIIYY